MKTVLIVEDTEDYAENLRFILSQAGYSVVVALDGKEGLEKAIRIKPDLILMDLLMPEQDGVETTIKIKEEESLKDVPVIFLTSVTAGENVVTSVNNRDFVTISKMIDQEKLLNRLREYLGN
jgi:DNA-binding response OmpR family regulator